MRRQQQNQLSVFETSRAGLVKVKALMFFASILLQTPMIEDPTCATAWTNMVVIGYNPAFIESLDAPTAKFVIIHEIMHIILKHGLRLCGRDPEEWNKCCISDDTLVLMADGTSKQAGNIRLGEYVWSPFGPSMVLDVIDKGIREVLHLSHNAGECWATPDHRFLTESGFIDAELQNTRLHGHILGVARSARIHSATLQGYVDARLGADDRRCLSQHRQVHGGQQAASRSIYDQASEYLLGACLDAIGAGLPGWDHRRRGHDLCSAEQYRVFTTAYRDLEYVNSPGRMAPHPWVRTSLGEEYHWAGLLADFMERLFSRQASAIDPTVPGNQGSARGFALGTHIASAATIEKFAADGTYARACLDDRMAERSDVVIRRKGETRCVIDLVTEHHVFAAGGLLTHNCDYAINIILKDLGFKVWQWALIDDRYRGMTAEQIYLARQLEREQNKGKGKSKQSGPGPVPQPGQGPQPPESTQGGLGGDLKPVPAVTADTRDRIEHEINKTLARATAIAREHGVMPGILEAIITATYEDTVPWDQVLIDYMSACVKTEENWRRRNRRYSDVILPSYYNDGMDELTIVADSSGSMFNKAIFERIAVAVNYIVTTIKPMIVRVVWADDSEMSSIDVFENGAEVMLHPKGGGGTDMRKPLTYVQEHFSPEVVLLLTDGYTPWLETPPPYPLIIGCITNAPCPDYASVVRIDVP